MSYQLVFLPKPELKKCDNTVQTKRLSMKVFVIFLISNREGRFQFKHTFDLSGLYNEIQQTKLTRHSLRIN